MKTKLSLLLLVFSLNTFAAYDVVCSGKISHHSPYPGASGSSFKVLKADLTKMSGDFRENRKSQKIDFSSITKVGDGKVELVGVTAAGDAVDLMISVFNSNGPRIKGHIGDQAVSYNCNANLRLNL